VSRRLETIVATCSGKISVELKANNFVERKINAQVTFVQAAPSKRSDATIGFLQILGEQTRRSPKQKILEAANWTSRSRDARAWCFHAQP
jgi:hypothetical protein